VHGTLGAITPLTATSANVTYTPALNYNGADSFTFTVNDGTVNSAAPATVSLTITPVNDPPVSTNHVVTTGQNTAVTLTLTATDIDSPALTFAIATAPTNGTLGAITGTTCTPNVTQYGNGSDCTAQVIYTPTTSYIGPDSFTFSANDGFFTSAATVSMTVFVDSDGDGIEDGIDTQPSVSSNDFSDVTTTSPTNGTINSRGDRVVNITDEPAPDGVRVFVTLGTQTAQITANCTVPVVIQVQPGNTYEGVVTCGSATVKTTAGRATVSKVVTGVATVVTDVRTGQTVKFDTNPTGDLTQTLSTINTTTQMTTAINTTHLAASFATGSAVTYTISSATGSSGAITAAATGGSVQVVIGGQTVPIAQDGTVGLTVGLLPGDVDGSGRVDGRDLITLSAAFGSNPTVTAWNANGDLDKSQSVDGSDLVILAAHFGAVQ
jgi:hypothetical protein